jgi:pimeloyl-ACP methyl ester carboxylesterase
MKGLFPCLPHFRSLVSFGRPIGSQSSRMRGIAGGAATAVAISMSVALVAGMNHAAGPDSRPTYPVPPPTRYAGTLPDGATWVIDAPLNWNGTLLLFAHGLVPPGAPNPPANATDPVTAGFLLNAGYALAGSSFATTGWAAEDALRDQADLLDVVAGTIGQPRITIAWGASLGGLVAAALAERAPRGIDGALSLCGVLAGGVGGWNSFLDVMFTIKTLIAPDAAIELTNISNPVGSIQTVVDVLGTAQATPEGRARIALAAAVGNIPGWTRADQPEPDRRDFEQQEVNQFEILRSLTAFLGIAVRADLEARAGGNPSFNSGVDYTDLLRNSADRREVLALYLRAGLDVSDDLQRLAAAPRITADRAALRYLTRFITLRGRLEVPVLTMHNIADPLAPVEHEAAYAAVVREADDWSHLRQVYVGRAGHCIFTPAETVAALQVVMKRVDSGGWTARTEPDHLNRRAAALGPALNAYLDDETGQPVPTAPAFVEFKPGRHLRPFEKPIR